MPIRSMTAFAQVKGQVRPDAAFTLALKSVNHRFLDLHLRMPPQSDALEIKLRRLLKEKIARGHVELTLALDGAGAAPLAVNQELVGGYVRGLPAAPRASSASPASPTSTPCSGMPGALSVGETEFDAESEARVLAGLAEAIAQLDRMRVEEGHGIERELRERMAPPAQRHRRGREASRRRLARLPGKNASPHEGADRRPRRPGPHPAGSRAAGRAQRHPGRDRAPAATTSSIFWACWKQAAKPARSWTSCCRR